GDRRAPPEMGRATAGGGGEKAGRRGDARAAARFLQGQGREVVDARRRRLRRAAAAHGDREALEDEAAPGFQGLQAAGGVRREKGSHTEMGKVIDYPLLVLLLSFVVMWLSAWLGPFLRRRLE